MKSIEQSRKEWIEWLGGYGAGKLFDAIIYNCQGAESECQFCGRTITFDIVEGGGVPDWGDNGDYGCGSSPETTEEGCGGHLPLGLPRPPKS